MAPIRSAASLAFVITSLIPSCLYAQGADAGNGLLQRLSSEYPLTVMTADKSDVATAGTVVALLKPGMMMYSTDCPVPALNNYKKGKISQGWGGFGRDLAGSMRTPEGTTVANYPHRQFQMLERLWVTGFIVKRDGIVFTLYSDPLDNVRYYGDLKFPFEKGSVPGPDQALATISEAIGKVDSSQFDQVAGAWAMPSAPQNHAQLNNDGTYSMVALGQSYTGSYYIQGSQMMFRTQYGATQGTLQGDTITETDGSKWVKQGGPAEAQAPAPAADPNVLRNDDVIKMVSAGLDSSIIIAKIRTSKCEFDTGTDALIQLKKSGVPSAVIGAMMQAASPR